MKGRAADSFKRPPLWVLLLVYAVWLGAIVVLATIPCLIQFGVITAFLFLFVWLPYWGYRNWQDVVTDPPATWATIFTALLILAYLFAFFRFDIPEKFSHSEKLGQTPDVSLTYHAFHLMLIWSIGPFWRFLKRRLQKRLA